MHDMWVSGVYDARDPKPARGAWLCPPLGVYSLTERAKAVDMNGGLHIGRTIVMLSALNSLGEELIIHMPRCPAPRWVANPKRPVPFSNLVYRIFYKTEVHPRIKNHSIVMVQSGGGYYDGRLSALLTRGEVPKACTL